MKQVMNTKQTFFSAVVLILLVLMAANRSFAAVGETYTTMAKRYGIPKQIDLNGVVRTEKIPRYKAAGVKAYIFEMRGVKVKDLPRISDFKVYALFNKDNVCYKMYTLNSRDIPDPALFLGSLAKTTPKVLRRVSMVGIELQYGNGVNAVIYSAEGLPGWQSAEAYSEALAPK